MASASPSTSYGAGNNSFQFDVFINHRGPDVKKGLASHLYHRLLADGLRVFLDIEELQGGDNLTPQIEGAIRTASVHVAIFSPRYAESSWCLKELVQMLESGKTILPIFYNVTPSELRWTRGGDGLFSRALNVSLLIILLSIPLCILLYIQPAIPISILLCILLCKRNKNGMYARALRKLGKQTTLDSQTNRQKPRYDYDTLEKWRESLFVASNISGFELSTCNGDEGQLVQKVVEKIWKKVGKTLLNVAKHPTGVEDKVKDFERTVLSQQQSGKTTVVGIVGLGGVGKTTLAKELFNRYRSNYDRSCFLSDVRKIAAKCSLNLLQSTLLKDLAQSDVQISSSDEGIEKLKRHLSPSHRALIVFDDVDHVSQLDALFLPIKHTIHSGSLILVTSRNKDLLKRSGIVKSFIYQQTRLNKEHSRELFCWHAFNHPHPCIGFEQVVEKFLDICDGLPLSLQVIGALLCYEDLKYWEEQLHKVTKNLPNDILSRLTISYDSLDEEEKQIFLDIACFFIGQDRDTAIRIWDGSGWQGWLGFRNLKNKCLVEVDSENCIRMHDHLRDMGKIKAWEETPHRLWRLADSLVHNVTDQSYVRGISMVQGNSPEESFKIPTNMGRLQLLRAEGYSVEKIFRVAQPPQLLWLCWYSCPFSSLPSWISVKNLRVLYIQGAELETLWHHECQAPLQLRELNVDANLLNVPKSIGTLKHLEKFVVRWKTHIGGDRWGQVELESLPDEVCDMHSLKYLELKRCKSLTSLPDSAGNWTNLQCIDLGWCSALKRLPDSAGNWMNLQHIDLRECSALQGLPDSAGNWRNLQRIDLRDCSALQGLPDSAGNWRNLQRIDLSACFAFQGLPDSARNWTNLQRIDLGCYALQALPDSAGNWTNLQRIDLGECSALRGIRNSAGNWTNLQRIDLRDCSALEELPDSAGSWTNLYSIDLCGCSALQGLPDSAGNWTNLQHIDLGWCSALQGLPNSAGNWTSLQRIDLRWCCALQGLPASAGNWRNLERIDLSCSALQSLPDSVGNWRNLQHIDFSGCSALEVLPDSVGSWTNVQRIDFFGCSALQGLPGSAGNWRKLHSIDFCGCSALQGLPDSTGNWTNLKFMDLRKCSSLQWAGEVVELLRERLNSDLLI